MQKAQLPEDAKELLETIERNRRNTVAARAELGFFEAWKRVADRKAHLIFLSLRLDGPTIPESRREAAIDHIQRLTWPEAFEGMTQEEMDAVWLENRDAINRYSLELAERLVAERWKRALAIPR